MRPAGRVRRLLDRLRGGAEHAGCGVDLRSEQASLERILVMGLIDWLPNQTLIYEGSGREYPLSTAGRTRVLGVAARVFDDGLLVPGELRASGFEDWRGTPADWLDRAARELDRFDWHSMGDGFWLRLTERGVQVAERSEEVL